MTDIEFSSIIIKVKSQNKNMINGKNQFLTQQKKVLSLSKTKSRFSTLSKQFQEKNTLMIINNQERKHFLFPNIVQIEPKQQIISQEKLQKSISYKSHPKQFVSKSLQNKNNKNNSIFNSKNLQEQRKNIPHSLEKNVLQKQQTKKSFEQQHILILSRHRKIIQLLKFTKNKQLCLKKQQQQNLNNLNQQKNKNIQIRKLNLVKSDNKSNKQSFVKSPQFRLKRISSMEIPNNMQTKKEESLDTSKNKISSNLSNNKLSIFSGLLQISIHQRKQNLQKINIEVQTIQTQAQLFEYLRYKRKKQIYEYELKDLFKDIQRIKKQRFQCHQRKLQFHNCCESIPKNDRQKRVFQLKRQMIQCEQSLLNQINTKHKTEEKLLEQIQHVQIVITNGISKLANMLKDYFKLFKEVFEKYSEEKYARISQRLQSLTSSFLIDLQRKVNFQIQKSRTYKDDTIQLRDIFKDYLLMKQQHKILLKNCFYQIMQLPEIFYELFGDKLKEQKVSESLIKQNKDLAKYKQKLKCLQCYNSEWKSYMIVDKNISIQPILKVAEQLVK